MSREKAGYPLIGYFASNNAYAAGLKDAERSRGQACRGDTGRLQLSLFAGLLADKYGFRLSDVKVLAAAIAVECRGALKGETVDARCCRFQLRAR